MAKTVKIELTATEHKLVLSYLEDAETACKKSRKENNPPPSIQRHYDTKISSIQKLRDKIKKAGAK